MRTLLLTLALTLLPGCISTRPDTLPTDGAIGRQMDRLIDRHDGYVLMDDLLPDAEGNEALAASQMLEALVGLPQVGRGAFRAALLPVADRHDAYVRADPLLDDLERETYLGTADGLRRLAGAGREPVE